MLHVRNFETADELMAHYRALKNRARPQPKLVRRTFPKIYPHPIGPEIPAETLQSRENIIRMRDAASMPTKTKARMMVLEICDECGVSWNEVLSPRRNAHIAMARRKMYWKLKTETQWSLPQIGRFLNRDHTSVLHGIRRFELDALHKRNDFPMPTTREFRLYEQSGCRAPAYLAARAAGRA